MKRRDFIALTAAATLAPLTLSAEVVDYTPGMAQAALANGETVFLDFSATWCGTCAAQDRVINALRDENPDYDANITFIKVDWDDYGNGDLSNALKIPRRSTLVVLKGDKELGRIIAGTARKQIKKLMDTALKAAMA
ncbi:MAG: thioredoxin family protein [Marinosulfonomonas sp.]|nr:thioredoxin family protein [Marinosulfonomonas sp.]